MKNEDLTPDTERAISSLIELACLKRDFEELLKFKRARRGPMPTTAREIMENAPMPDDTMMRIPTPLVMRAVALLPLVHERRELIGYGRLTRAAVIRLALERGLTSLERQLGANPKGGRSG